MDLVQPILDTYPILGVAVAMFVGFIRHQESWFKRFIETVDKNTQAFIELRKELEYIKTEMQITRRRND